MLSEKVRKSPETPIAELERLWVWISYPLLAEVQRRLAHEHSRPRQGEYYPSFGAFGRRAVVDYMRRHPVPRDWTSRPEPKTPGFTGEIEKQSRVRFYMRCDAALINAIDRHVSYELSQWESATAEARMIPRKTGAKREESYPSPPTRSRLVRRALREWLRRNPA